jgi:hypothetical protein
MYFIVIPILISLSLSGTVEMLAIANDAGRHLRASRVLPSFRSPLQIGAADVTASDALAQFLESWGSLAYFKYSFMLPRLLWCYGLSFVSPGNAVACTKYLQTAATNATHIGRSLQHDVAAHGNLSRDSLLALAFELPLNFLPISNHWTIHVGRVLLLQGFVLAPLLIGFHVSYYFMSSALSWYRKNCVLIESPGVPTRR